MVEISEDELMRLRCQATLSNALLALHATNTGRKKEADILFNSVMEDVKKYAPDVWAKRIMTTK
jgi:hypothetical protein